MKKKLLLALLSVFLINLSAQELKIPKVIKESFAKHYDDYKNVKWSMEGDGNFEAEFEIDNVQISVVFNKLGKLLEIETKININELPKSILNFIKNNYEESKLTDAYIVEVFKDNISVMQYEVEFINGKIKKELLFDVNGKLIERIKNDNVGKDEDNK